MRLSLGRCDFAGVMTAAISINNNYYVEKYFPDSDKERVLEMVGNLQTALGERIAALDWMGGQAKARAGEAGDL